MRRFLALATALAMLLGCASALAEEERLSSMYTAPHVTEG